MESRYGIGVNNRYALFLDSDNEDGDNIEDIMLKKTSIPGDNQNKKALKDSQAKTKDAPVKKDANTKVASNKDPAKPNNREGKCNIFNVGKTKLNVNSKWCNCYRIASFSVLCPYNALLQRAVL